MQNSQTDVNQSADDNDDARNMFLECALDIAGSIDSLEGRAEIRSLVAFRYAEAGEIDHAVNIAETINDAYLRDQALAGIAAKCIEAGVPDYADAISDTIEDDTAYALATEQMAVAHAEAGAFEKSIEVAQRLAESAPTLCRIALSCAAVGSPVQAVEAAGLIDYPDLKVPVLVELAAKALQDQRNTDALALLQEATSSAEDIEFSDQRISTLVTIASLNKRSGQEDRALEILTRAHEQCKESEDFDSDATLAQIAGGFAELNRYDRADQVIEEIENPFQFAHATVLVSLEYQKAGDTAKALELLADAMEIVRDQEVYGELSLSLRENLLSELAGCYAFFGHYDEALQVTELMSAPDRRHHSLKDIAKHCERAGHNSRVLQVIEVIEDPYARVLGELEMVDAFIASGKLELADRTLSQTVTRATLIMRPYEKAMALIEIAPRFAKREQASHASQVLFNALQTLATIDDGYHQSQALINLAAKYQKLGQQAGEKEQAILEDVLHRLEP